MKNKGTAFIELLVVLPIFITFLVGISFFARLFITDIFLNQAAHYGVFLIVYKNYDVEQVRDAIIEYLNNKNLLPGIKKDKIYIGVDLGLAWHGPAKVEIKYNIPIPELLKKLPEFSNGYIVRGYSECYNDSWYLGFPNNHSKS